jgi:hypothetical protein
MNSWLALKDRCHYDSPIYLLFLLAAFLANAR